MNIFSKHVDRASALSINAWKISITVSSAFHNSAQYLLNGRKSVTNKMTNIIRIFVFAAYLQVCRK